jgi:8-oxo-dGTP diphosphatase
LKNHKIIGGRLLQTNKKWSALKERQRHWILELAAEEHAAYVSKTGKLPVKAHKAELLDRIYQRVCEREIWIPYGEFKMNVSKRLARLNRKSPLFVPPKS